MEEQAVQYGIPHRAQPAAHVMAQLQEHLLQGEATQNTPVLLLVANNSIARYVIVVIRQRI